MKVSVFALVAILGVLFIASPQAFAQDKSLVLYYSFEGKGDTVKDLSGNGNDGTIHGPSRVDGKITKGLRFDGVDDYVETPPSDSLNLNKMPELTLVAWVKVDAYVDWERIISMINAKDTKDSIAFGISASDGVYIGLWNNDVQTYIDGQGGVPLNEWTHVAATWSDSTIDIYVNGEKQPSTMIDQGTGGETKKFEGPIDENGLMKLGIGQEVAEGQEFHGAMDEIAIYSRAMNASEIQNIMKGIKSPVGKKGKLAISWGIIKTR